MYIDIHCHLDLLQEEGIKRIVGRAGKNGVGVMLTNGVNPETNKKAFLMASEFPEVKAALGIYPIEGIKMSEKEIDSEIDFIRKEKESFLCIGEVGLDFKEGSGNKEKQESVFRKFVSLAIELGKPITIHSRKAEKRCIEILEEMNAKKVIMHYFSGRIKLVEKILENNWFLSIPTAVKNSEHFQKIIEITPIENLFCETDSPYSHPDKKFPNEPGNVIESYKKIAEIKNLGLKEVEEKIEENYERLFRK